MQSCIQTAPSLVKLHHIRSSISGIKVEGSVRGPQYQKTSPSLLTKNFPKFQPIFPPSKFECFLRNLNKSWASLPLTLTFSNIRNSTPQLFANFLISSAEPGYCPIKSLQGKARIQRPLCLYLLSNSISSVQFFLVSPHLEATLTIRRTFPLNYSIVSCRFSNVRTGISQIWVQGTCKGVPPIFILKCAEQVLVYWQEEIEFFVVEIWQF